MGRLVPQEVELPDWVIPVAILGWVLIFLLAAAKGNGIPFIG